MGWQAVTSAANFAIEKVSIPTRNITEAGYMFIFLSYENQSDAPVYFDDFKVTHMSKILQYNEYYPFGLQTNSSWTRENTSNNYLYNSANELNTSSGWYETFFRGYDPAIGRFLQVDPLSFSEQATYQYAANNPVMFNDPNGAFASTGSPWGRGNRFYQLTLGNLSGNISWSEGGSGFHSRSGAPGSGFHWTDGIKYSDWTLNGGSETYLSGLAAGALDIGGHLWTFYEGGRGLWTKNENGSYGYYKTTTRTVDFAKGRETFLESTWVSLPGGSAQQTGLGSDQFHYFSSEWNAYNFMMRMQARDQVELSSINGKQ